MRVSANQFYFVTCVLFLSIGGVSQIALYFTSHVNEGTAREVEKEMLQHASYVSFVLRDAFLSGVHSGSVAEASIAQAVARDVLLTFSPILARALLAENATMGSNCNSSCVAGALAQREEVLMNSSEISALVVEKFLSRLFYPSYPCGTPPPSIRTTWATTEAHDMMRRGEGMAVLHLRRDAVPSPFSFMTVALRHLTSVHNSSGGSSATYYNAATHRTVVVHDPQTRFVKDINATVTVLSQCNATVGAVFVPMHACSMSDDPFSGMDEILVSVPSSSAGGRAAGVHLQQDFGHLSSCAAATNGTVCHEGEARLQFLPPMSPAAVAAQRIRILHENFADDDVQLELAVGVQLSFPVDARRLLSSLVARQVPLFGDPHPRWEAGVIEVGYGGGGGACNDSADYNRVRVVLSTEAAPGEGTPFDDGQNLLQPLLSQLQHNLSVTVSRYPILEKVLRTSVNAAASLMYLDDASGNWSLSPLFAQFLCRAGGISSPIESLCPWPGLCFFSVPGGGRVVENNTVQAHHLLMTYHWEVDDIDEPVARGSLWWSGLAVWSATVVCGAAVILATRRLYVLPTVALGSLLAAALAAPSSSTGGAGPSEKHFGSAVFDRDDDAPAVVSSSPARRYAAGGRSLSASSATAAVGSGMARKILTSLFGAVSAAGLALDPCEMEALSDETSEEEEEGGDVNDGESPVVEVLDDMVHHIGGIGIRAASVVELEDDEPNPQHRGRGTWSRASSIAVPLQVSQGCVSALCGALLGVCRRVFGFLACRRHSSSPSSLCTRRRHIISSTEGHAMHTSLSQLFDWVHSVAKYVPKEVVADLMRMSNAPGAAGRSRSRKNGALLASTGGDMAQRIITILFCDIANFTTFCEHVEPEDMVDLLEVYFAKMTSVLLQHGCTIDKFIGDAIMGFWGAPLDYHNQGFSACCAALHMQHMVVKLRPQFERFNHSLRVRVGIHRGMAAVGNIGCRVRLSYTALGDAVNTAARLEGLNKHFGTTVCVSQPVLNDIDGGHVFGFRALGSVRVKGKFDALQVFELVGVCHSAHNSHNAAGHCDASKNNKVFLGARDGASEYSGARSCQTGLSTVTDKFAELSMESELLTAKRFRTVTDRQLEILAKIESAILQFQSEELGAAINALEAVIADHSRALEKMDIDVGRLRSQAQQWRRTQEALELGELEYFDPCITMNEK